MLDSGNSTGRTTIATGLPVHVDGPRNAPQPETSEFSPFFNPKYIPRKGGIAGRAVTRAPSRGFIRTIHSNNSRPSLSCFPTPDFPLPRICRRPISSQRAWCNETRAAYRGASRRARSARLQVGGPRLPLAPEPGPTRNWVALLRSVAI